MTERDYQVYLDGLVPLVIGVTGHRNLVPGEIPGIREIVRSFFLELKERFRDRPLQVFSALAEGSDRLVAEVAVELNLRLVVPLPAPRLAYLEEFGSGASRREFERLCDYAEAVYELSSVPRNVSEQGSELHNSRYAQLGVFICAHSHILLALWDGKSSVEVGGTAEVVRFHHHDVMAGHVPSHHLERQLLEDDESDLVYHIVVSRDREDGAPADGLDPLGRSWFTTDEAMPRSAEIPEKYSRIFDRTGEFNRHVRENRRRILSESPSLIDAAVSLPAGARTIASYFCAADWLASYFRRRTHVAIQLTHYLAFLMGMMFIIYSDVTARGYFMAAFLFFFLMAYLAHRLAARGQWQRKHLEYRALAEGLRVQFYWAVSGVVSEDVTEYVHDGFLQKQDVDLGWIRNVMRVAGTGCDVSPNLDPRALSFSERAWVGDDRGGGQVEYYGRKAAGYRNRSRCMERLGELTAIVIPVLLIAMVGTPSDRIRDLLLVPLGLCLLALSVRQSYAHRIAEREIIRQYEFMHRLFGSAQRRLKLATNDSDRRAILRVLGESALEEHAEWVLLHRDRPLDHRSLWRMEA